MRYRVKEHKMIKVVDSKSDGGYHEVFSAKINEHIAAGWEMHGDFVYRAETSTRHGAFYQAMVKYHDPFEKVAGE